MKTIGIIGGLSWYSSSEYYRAINRLMNERLGESYSAKCIMYSFEYQQMAELEEKRDWERAGYLLAEAAKSLERGGADFVVMPCNTHHISAQAIEAAISIPFLHIADSLGQELVSRGMTKVGLLGTRFTMKEDFYKERLLHKFGIDTVVPSEHEMEMVHGIIYDELCQGIVSDASREQLNRVICHLQSAGAEGIVLGCTELPLIIRQEDSQIPVFDTMLLHAKAAVDFSLENRLEAVEETEQETIEWK